MADKKETTPHLGVCSCIFLILNVLCNNGFNALVAVAALYPHLHFFSSSPGEDFESTCTNFKYLLLDIHDHQIFVAPYFCLYWLLDIIADIFLWRMLRKNECSYAMILLKAVNFLLLLAFGIYYSFTWKTQNHGILVLYDMNLFLKALTSVFRLPSEIAKRVALRQAKKEKEKSDQEERQRQKSANDTNA